MRDVRPPRSATAALLLLTLGAVLLVFGIDTPPSSALAADSTVIRVEDGEVVRTIRIDGREIERTIEEALAVLDDPEFEHSLAAALEGLDGLGEEIAAALDDLDFDYDPDRGYAYSYRGHFDQEEFGRRMAEFGERMAAQQERIAERVHRAVERAHREDATGADDEESLRREIRRLERRLERLQRELQELDAVEPTDEAEASPGGQR